MSSTFTVNRWNLNKMLEQLLEATAGRSYEASAKVLVERMRDVIRNRQEIYDKLAKLRAGPQPGITISVLVDMLKEEHESLNRLHAEFDVELEQLGLEVVKLLGNAQVGAVASASETEA
jgi:hypothetical protein